MSGTVIAHNLQQASHQVEGKGWSPVYLFCSEAVITLGGKCVAVRCLGRGLPGMGGRAALELAPQEKMTDPTFLERFPDILKIAFPDQVWALQCSLPVRADSPLEGERALARHNLLSLKDPTVYRQFSRLGGVIDFRRPKGKTWQNSSSPKLEVCLNCKVVHTREALLRLATWQMGHQVGAMLYDTCMQEEEFTGWYLDIYFAVGLVRSTSTVVVQLAVAGHGTFKLEMMVDRHRAPTRYDRSGFTKELDAQYRAWLEWMPLPQLERMCLARYEEGNGQTRAYFLHTNHLVHGHPGFTYEEQQTQDAARCAPAPMPAITHNAPELAVMHNVLQAPLAPKIAVIHNALLAPKTAVLHNPPPVVHKAPPAPKPTVRRNARPPPRPAVRRNTRPASRPAVRRNARPASRPAVRRNARPARKPTVKPKRSPNTYIPPAVPQNARYLLPKHGVAFDRAMKVKRAEAMKRLLRR